MASKWDVPSSSAVCNADQYETQTLNSNLKLLKPLDEILRCPICFEYYSDCLTTKCGHNYCSLCIRRYMMYKTQCPTCFQVSTEPELKNNRLIDEIVAIYKTLRNNIELKLATPDLARMSDDPVEEIETLEERVTDTLVDNVQCNSGNQMTDFEKVPCPVCDLLVLPVKINAHLDNCLISNERIPTSPMTNMKLLPKIVYHLLTDNEIKKILRQQGLCTSGDRQTLIRRHKSFLVLYNANCDSLQPRSVSEIIEQIEAQEIEEKTNMTPNRVHSFHKKSEIALIEREQELYLRRHCDQFDSLIEDIRTRLQKERNKPKKQNRNITNNLSSEVNRDQDGDSDSSLYEDSPKNASKVKNDKHHAQNR